MSIQGSDECQLVSELRARRVAKSVRRLVYAAYGGQRHIWGQRLVRLVTHEGFGDTRPLSGYDDGLLSDQDHARVHKLH